MKLPVDLLGEMYDMLKHCATHRGCEDGWYACPKSPDYIQHADESGECDCGAEDVQKLLAKIEEVLRRD
jgi:hypothetical protein